MAVDITTIPLEELEKDLKESIDDIRVCREALLQGVTFYSGGNVADRLKANEGFVAMITAEIGRREALTQEANGG